MSDFCRNDPLQLKVDQLEKRVVELTAQVQSLAEAGEYASQGGLITLGILRDLETKVNQLAKCTPNE